MTEPDPVDPVDVIPGEVVALPGAGPAEGIATDRDIVQVFKLFPCRQLSAFIRYIQLIFVFSALSLSAFIMLRVEFLDSIIII
jgi:hypothetical protein